MVDNFYNFDISLLNMTSSAWPWLKFLWTDTLLYLNPARLNSYELVGWINKLISDMFIMYNQILSFNELYVNTLNLNLTLYTKNLISLLLVQSSQYYSLNSVNTELLILQQSLTIENLTYNFMILWIIIKFSVITYFIYYVLIYSYFNTNQLNNLQNSSLAKFLHLIESEEELGSVDDAFTLIFLFIIVFGWFFTLSLCFNYIFNSQLTLFGLAAIILIFFILLTPFSTLLDFGIAFTSYIRGASSSANLLVECIFDIIGTLVVFTRFVVQNIRFVLIFFAYFELFEWVYNSIFLEFFLNYITLNKKNYIEFNLYNLDMSKFFMFFAYLIVTIISYLYYLVHLLILVFVQTTIYLLISFWLFFFFYTSFTLNTTEKVFIKKKMTN
uniref:Uncharacterized protein n=1 Tax=Thuricola similis TaxID=2784598 RepID=A0A7T8G524_9CILI|nr:hypothetical protein K4Z05_mgp31 [Thuricola similis]QQP22132.1 hypothetical protein TSIM_19 [Thuricola similis]